MNADSVLIAKPHIALRVKHLTASIEFYRRLFGAEPAKVAPGYAKFDLQNPPLNFTLNETDQVAPGALWHLGLQVNSTADVLRIREQWRRGGLSTREEREVQCCQAVQDKVWAQDPDGNQWEAFVVIRDAPGAAHSSCCQPSCCDGKAAA